MRNSLISFLLIFAYSIGFAHELIPHYHVEDGYSDVRYAEMHHHVSPEERDIDDIAHNDHLDDGFLDYLLCIISHADHSAYDYVEIVHQGTDLSIDKFVSSGNIAVFSQDGNILVPCQKSSKVISKPCTALFMEQCKTQRRRGPPQFS